MPSTQGHRMGTFTSDFAGMIWLADDGLVGSMELAAKISEMLTWKRDAISESLESQGRR